MEDGFERMQTFRLRSFSYIEQLQYGHYSWNCRIYGRFIRKINLYRRML